MRTIKQILHLLLCAGFMAAPLHGAVRDTSDRGCHGCVKDILCDIREELKDANACGNAIPITQKDIGTTGYVIDKPGKYCLAENVVFAPTDPATFVPVTFTGGSPTTPATGFAAVSGGVARGVFLTNRGAGYTSAPSVSFGGSGAGAAGTAVLGDGNPYHNMPQGTNAPVGTVAFVEMSAGGSGYKDTVQAAITITCSEASLSLNGNHLSQYVPSNPSAQVPFVVGILVPDPLPNATQPSQPNVVIPGDTTSVGQSSVYVIGNDGIVSDFSMYGVRIFAHVADVEVSDLTIKDCGALASKALGHPTASGLTYLPFDQIATSGLNVEERGFTPQPSSFGPSFDVAGLAIGEGSGFGRGPQFFTDYPLNQLNVVNRIANVRINNVNALNNYMQGGSVICTTDLTIKNSHFDYSWSDDPGSSTVPAYGVNSVLGMRFVDIGSMGFGVGLPNGNTNPNNVNVYVENCTFNNTSMRGDYTTPLPLATTACVAGGINDTKSKNVYFLNCSLDNSSCTFPALNTLGGAVFGYAAGGMEDLTFENCYFNQESNLGAVAGLVLAGISITAPTTGGQNIAVLNCTANNLQSRSDLILPAPMTNNSAAIGFNLAYGKGFYLDGCQSRDVYLNGPIIPSASPTLGDAGVALGYVSIPYQPAEVTDYTFKNCIASRAIALNGGCAAGYSDQIIPANTGNSIIYEGCISTGNQALLVSVAPAWNGDTTYSVGNQVSLLLSGSIVNYVSLINTNLDNNPATSSDWSVINSSTTSLWLVGTTYNIGDLVSYTDATNHTFEYISTIDGNQGIYPIAPGPGSPYTDLTGDFTPFWLQTNVYPTWQNSPTTYSAGMVVGYNGVSYISTAQANQGNEPDTSGPAYWTTNIGIFQSAALGFASQQQLPAPGLFSGPEIYKNCIAAYNYGSNVPVVGAPFPYSGGFWSESALGTIYDSCQAVENTGYGFILTGSCTNCVMKFSEADSNSVEGFTDCGQDVNATPGSIAPSASFFESNNAYNNGEATAFTGQNQNYNVVVNSSNTPLATYNIRVANPNAADSYEYANPAKPGPAHNVSAIPN